jgi:nucleoside-diphosphate kinase
MKEKTIFVIKPDAYKKQDKILLDISMKFNIDHLVEQTFTKELVDDFYPTDIGRDYYEALLEYMTEGPSVIGLISGENAVPSFFELAGTKTNPPDCHPDSLRYKYAKGYSQTPSGLYLIKNGIHRPKSMEELDFDLGLLKKHKIYND